MPGARITGVAELRIELEKVSQRFQRKVIQEASHVAALDLERHIVTALNQGPATGRVYTHYMFMKGGKLMQGRKRDTPHQASAKGEYPMTDMGVLASSISTRPAAGAPSCAAACRKTRGASIRLSSGQLVVFFKGPSHALRIATTGNRQGSFDGRRPAGRIHGRDSKCLHP